MPREEFSDVTKRVLAQRAAYRCSVPGCNRLTIGPGIKEDLVENTGFAAHIYSAGASGPRGQGDLSPDKLKAASNGIWVCGHHASLIDKNSGIRYPATVLKGWKALHEYRVAYEHSDRTSVFGFVRTLKVARSALFEANTEIELGKTTFIIGPNDSGKTALCQWISSVDNLSQLWRWISPTTLEFSVKFDAPIEHLLAIQTGNGSIAVKLDGAAAAFNHHRIAVTFLRNRGQSRYNDDLDRISTVLALDKTSTRSLISLAGAEGIYLKGAHLAKETDDNNQPVEKLYCRLADGKDVPFATLSGGQMGRVILDLAIFQMRNVALFAPALLILEWNGIGIDDDGLQEYLEHLADAKNSFQTLITLYASKPQIEGLGWQSYRICKLDSGLFRIEPTFA